MMYRPFLESILTDSGVKKFLSVFGNRRGASAILLLTNCRLVINFNNVVINTMATLLSAM